MFIMKLIEKIDTSSVASKAGVALRTVWKLAKPVLFLTVLFFAIGTFFLFAIINKAAFGYKS